MVTARINDGLAEMLLYGDIGKTWDDDGITAKDVREALTGLPQSVDTVLLRINSVGGSVIEGLAMVDMLRNSRFRVITAIDGVAASIASAIAVSGNVVEMAANARLMIHQAWGVVVGNKVDMRKVADQLETWDDQLVQLYVEKTGSESSVLRKAMEAETWFTAKEALALGYVDVIADPNALAAKVPEQHDLARFARAPTDWGSTVTQPPKKQRLTVVQVRQRMVELGLTT